MLGRRVLVTGAAGGVGRFATQLAARAGAEVVAVTRRSHTAEALRALGAAAVVTDAAAADGLFDAVLDVVGGSHLAGAVAKSAPGATIVLIGASDPEPTPLRLIDFIGHENVLLLRRTAHDRARPRHARATDCHGPAPPARRTPGRLGRHQPRTRRPRGRTGRRKGRPHHPPELCPASLGRTSGGLTNTADQDARLPVADRYARSSTAPSRSRGRARGAAPNRGTNVVRANSSSVAGVVLAGYATPRAEAPSWSRG
jgi:hypothetical protein